MMRKVIAGIVAVFLSLTLAQGQEFEGKIIYHSSFKSNLPNVTDQQLELMMGTRSEFFSKKGNYKTVTNGTLLLWQVFINKDNKIYSKMASSEALLWNDVTISTDEIIKAEINKNVVTILGYPCDELVLTRNNGVDKFYFNSALKVDPEHFVNHKLGSWNEFTRRSNALPLKMILTQQQFIFESTATEILPMKLDDNIFVLPAGAKTEKSPF